jgi:SAM-dependent methyltransferase
MMSSATLDLGSLAELRSKETPPEPTGSRFSAAIYDPFLALGERFGMGERRERLLCAARGRVLEIGAGTGLNLDHYPDAVTELLLSEPVPAMGRRLTKRLGKSGRKGEVLESRAEELPVPDASVDTVVSTMVLCTVGDPIAALSEIARVLKPDGAFLFCEHVRSDSPRLERWQRRLARPWRAFAEGCRCDQPTLDLIARELQIETVEQQSWRGMPSLVRPLVIGRAVRAQAADR